MKQVLFSLVAVAGISTAAQAQSAYKPTTGNRTLEVNFAPLGGSPITIGGIKYRKFTADNKAWRVGVFVGHNSSSTVTQDENSQANLVELKDRERETSISLQPGIEKHFAGTERLSPYIGAVLNIGYGMTWEKDEAQFNTSNVGYTLTKGGSLDLGINAVTGFDYYVDKHLYLGTEIGFGFGMHKDLQKKTETVSYDAAGAETTTSGESNVNNKSNMQIGPNVIGQIRLGWVF